MSPAYSAIIVSDTGSSRISIGVGNVVIMIALLFWWFCRFALNENKPSGTF
jgi:hypothetical protein